MRKPKQSDSNRSQKNNSKNHVWIYGKHAVLAALNNPRRTIHNILVTSKMRETLPEKCSFPVEIVTIENCNRILPEGAVHQGIAVKVATLPTLDIYDFCAQAKESSLVIALDQVTDPQNVGAILRSAAAFGADALIVPEHHSPEETGAMAKAASGALEIIPVIRAPNLSKTMKMLKEHGFWWVGLDSNADCPLEKTPHYDKLCIVMGAEGKGIRRLTRNTCDIITSIPTSNDVESLNVSTSAAIALYHFSRNMT